MKTLLFAPETFNLAETTRMIEVAKACKPQANCFFIGYSREFSALIEAEGFPFTLLSPELTSQDITVIMKFDQGKSLKNPFTYDLLKKRIEAELQIITTLKPDAIIIGSTISLLISARVAKVPLAYAKPFALSRGHIESSEFLKKKIGRRLIQRIALSIKWLPKDMKRLIKEYDVSEYFNYTIDALDADLNGITTPELFTNHSKLPSNSCYVGPIFAHLKKEIPETVQSLINKHKRPLIFCSLGSSANSELVYQVLSHFDGLDVDVISPMSYFLTTEQRQTLPSNVHLYDWLPALEIQEQVDVSVLHGGEGTIQTACFSGKPFIGIGLQAEQSYNIACCVNYGNAKAFPLRQIKRRSAFQQAVTDLLTDQALLSHATKLKQLLEQEEPGAEKMAQAIFNFLSTKNKKVL